MHGGWHGHGGSGNSYLDEEEQLGAVYEHRVVSRLVGYLGSFKRSVALAVVGTLLYMASSVALPRMVGLAVDDYIRPKDWDGLLWFSALFLVVALIGAVASCVQLLETARVGNGLVLVLRRALFAHLQRLSMGFWDRSQVGRIMSRVTNDVQQIQEVMTQGLVGTISQLLMLVAVAVVMVMMDPVLALATLAVIPLLIIVTTVWRKRARDAFVGVRRAIAVVNGTLNENVSGMRAIQSMRREEENLRMFDEVNRAHLDANITAARLVALMMPIVEVQSALAMGVIIVFGGYRVLSGATTPGELITFFLYAERVFEPLRQILMQYTQLQRAMAGGVRVFELLDTEPQVQDQPGAPEMPLIRGEIAFRDVTFAYLPGQPVLQDVSVTIQPGETVALVGPTGAGKTTLVNLVARLYDVTGGSITIDGHDLRGVQQRSLSRQMGVVLQDPFLFSDTVRQNIRFGRPGATDEEVERAARAVGADDFITRLERGYDTVLEERGGNLSVGQRQLVSFARALLAGPRILILDEATANIDTRTEVMIQEALRELLKGRTAIVIAHRLSTIREADRILVLDHGRLVESGTHQELLAQEGLYARLYAMTYVERPDVVTAGDD